jgi:mRNA interferase MazF
MESCNGVKMQDLRNMSKDPYVPDRGDFIWIVLDPRVDHEQSGRRPAIVLSKRLFTERTGLAAICLITSKVKGLPFEIQIKSENIDGAVLPIHLRTVDVTARKSQFISKASESVLLQVTEAVSLLIS